jgi:hypothetical protein
VPSYPPIAYSLEPRATQHKYLRFFFIAWKKVKLEAFFSNGAAGIKSRSKR